MSRMPALSAPGRRWQIASLALYALGHAAAGGVAAVATRTVFAALHGSTGVATGGARAALLLLALCGLAIGALRWSERLAAERLGQEYAAELRVVLFKHIARLPASELDRRRHGGLSLRFVGDLSAVQAWISRGVSRLISAAIVIPITIAVLFWLNPLLAIAAVVPIGAVLALMVAAGPGLLEIHRQTRARRSRLASDLAERAPQAAQLRMLGRLRFEVARVEELSMQLIQVVLKRRARQSLLRVLPDVASGLAAATLMWMAFASHAPAAEAAAGLAATGILVMQLRELGAVWDRYCAWHAARARCLALFAVALLPASRKAPQRTRDEGAGGVAVRVARSANMLPLQLAPGEKVCLSGPNGVGKSRLLRRMAGLEADPDDTIRIDGHPLRAWSGRQAKSRIVYLGDGAPLLAGSLRRALTLGLARRPDDGKIIAGATRFGLGPVLERLGGLDGYVSEGGRNLSDGERQRLLLARVALTDAELLLLDEPDSGLDAAGFAALKDFLAASPATVVCVTHQPQADWPLARHWHLATPGELVELDAGCAPSNPNAAVAA